MEQSVQAVSEIQMLKDRPTDGCKVTTIGHLLFRPVGLRIVKGAWENSI